MQQENVPVTIVNQQKTAAALRIQKVARQFLAIRRIIALKKKEQEDRKQLEKNVKALLIQCLWRGGRGRKIAKAKKQEVLEREAEIEAARLLQTHWRNYHSSLLLRQSQHSSCQLSKKEKFRSVLEEESAVLIQSIWRMKAARMQLKKDLAAKEVHEKKCRAAGKIQRLVRKVLAKKQVARIKEEREHIDEELVQQEAAEVLRRFIRYAAGVQLRRKRHEARLLEVEQLKKQDACRVIMALLKMKNVRRVTVEQRKLQIQEEIRQLEELAAVTIQAIVRRRADEKYAESVRKEKLHQDDIAKLHEAAALIQCRVRGFQDRKKVQQKRNWMRLFSMLQPMGRGLLDRGHVFTLRRKCIASVHIQKQWKKHAAQHQFQIKKALRRGTFMEKKREQSAMIMQRNWRKIIAKGLYERQQEQKRKKHVAAGKLQRIGRKFISVIRLQKLKKEKQDEIQVIVFRQATLLIQSQFRRCLAKLQFLRLRKEKKDAMKLIFRVANSYLSRKATQARNDIRRVNMAADLIQLGWKKHIKMHLARKKAQEKREYIQGIKRRENAAVMLQKHYRRFTDQKIFQKVEAKRIEAVKKIQARTKMFFAKKMRDQLHLAAIEVKYARKIQNCWMNCRARVFMKSEEKNLEMKLAAMELESLVKQEIHQRKENGAKEEERRLAIVTQHRQLAESITEKDKKKLEQWKKRAPLELQEVSAVRIQAMVRKHAAKLFAGKVQKEKVERELSPQVVAAGLTRFYGAAEGTSEQEVEEASSSAEEVKNEKEGKAEKKKSLFGGSVMPSLSLTSTWLVWLYQHPEVNKRVFERLLQRESAGRKRLMEEAQVELFSLSDRAQKASGTSDRRPATTGKLQLPPLFSLHPSTASLSSFNKSTTPTEGDDKKVSLSRAALLAARTLSQSYTPDMTPLTAAAVHAVKDVNDDIARQMLTEKLVNLSDSGFTETSLRPVLHRMRVNQCVTTLILDGNPIRDVSCIDLADVLQHNETLTHLSLARTGISNVGASHLLAALKKKNRTLSVLDLSHTYVEDRYQTVLQATLSRSMMVLPLVEEAPREGDEQEKAASTDHHAVLINASPRKVTRLGLKPLSIPHVPAPVHKRKSRRKNSLSELDEYDLDI